MQTIRKTLSFLAIAITVLAFSFTAQAQTATGERRAFLGLYATPLWVPLGTDLISAEPQQYEDYLGVKIVYEYPLDATQFELRYVIIDECSVLKGQVAGGYRKARISRFEITNAYWDATGRVEPGTFTVCAYELILR